LTVLVFWVKYLLPKLWRLSLYEVASLPSEQVVAVGDLNKLFVTGSPCSLVSCEGEIGVSFFAVLADNLRIVVLVFYQEILNIFVAGINVDFSEGIVKCRLLNSLLISGFKPV